MPPVALRAPRRVFCRAGVAALFLSSLAPRVAAAQHADTSLGIRWQPRPDTLTLPLAGIFAPRARLGSARTASEILADERAVAVAQALRARLTALWGETAAASFAPPAGTGAPLGSEPSAGAELVTKPPPAGAQPGPDSAARADTTGAGNIFGEYADLGLQVEARLESKLERNKNERCVSSQFFLSASGCRSSFQPNLDFQFNARSGGVVADRVHVNLDYDSQREFDASNNISLYYEGKRSEVVQRLEIGNVSFQLPPSRFITAGIPSGNYGVQAVAKLGPASIRTIAAQQKGNVVRDRVFTIGDRTLQAVDHDIEDYQLEARRFFFTIDPRRLPGYPNVDILDPRGMAALAASLPDTLRPTKIFLYRQRIGAQPDDPNGPQFSVRGAKNPSRQIYEYLQEGTDYYVDPSLLWVALTRQVSLNNERLVVAYRVRINGRDTVHVSSGGTPDVQFRPTPQFANLLYEPEITPRDSAFAREIRSVYRVGGEEVQRQSVTVKVVTNSSGDQEKPVAGRFDSYLQLFGLAQPTNGSTFDAENRLWPRRTDPNFNPATGGTGSRTIGDYFVVFPSLAPFATDGPAGSSGNPVNDTIYTTPNEDLYSSRHPQSLYHLRVHYEGAGSGDAGSLSLGSVQLRQSSERILVDGIPLTRGTDYSVDYDLGRVTFTRPDTLFPRPRQVTVRYEENPLFASTPTSIFGTLLQFPSEHGQVNFTLISQTQKTTFTRPPLGLEPASSLIVGVSGAFTFDAAPLTRALDRLPLISTSAPSKVTVQGEMAMSRPQPNSAGQAYVESFEGQGGFAVQLSEPFWYYSSQPVESQSVAALTGSPLLDLSRASALAWQTNGFGSNRTPVAFSLQQIDPLVRISAGGFTFPEQLLWLTLYPLRIGGALDDSTKQFRWRIPSAPGDGYRWRSVRTPLGPSGVDLSAVETLEFWALVDTASAKRATNPALVFDFGDVSENSVAIAPDTLRVTAGGDSTFSGKRLQGLDVLNTERDPFSRAFDVATNDVGLPGDRIDSLTVVTATGTTVATNVAICSHGTSSLQYIGDTRADCTVRNNRLDEEDLDLDNALNLNTASRGSERVLRYVVDLAKASAYDRVGRCEIAFVDTVVGRPQGSSPLCWVHVRVPFGAASDTINTPLLRRIKSLRITMVGGRTPADTGFSTVALARLRLVGPPWLKRSDRLIAGPAGDVPTATGFVVASLIGTADSSRSVVYESPPGVTDEPATRNVGVNPAVTEINEHSLRLTAVVPGGVIPRYHRAEAYFRFPEGEKNFMGYKELRVWARGRGSGWGRNGELEFYIKLGRDANNFYLYHTPVNSGADRAAWLPEVRVEFQRFYDLRSRVQNAFLQSGRGNALRFACTGADSALVRASLPGGLRDSLVYAACADGYIVYTVDPNVSPPNLAAVQEMAVGMVRIGDGSPSSDPLVPGDTAELWVDDIRLGRVVNTPGFAGQVGVAVTAGDVAELRVNVSRRDANFRQLAEQPSFVGDQNVEIASAVRLDKFLPRSLGVVMPLTINYSSAGSDPLFASRSDVSADAVPGLRTPRSSAASYTVGLRRATPLRGSPFAALVNNLALTGTWAAADSRSEYQTGNASNFSLGVDYNVAAESRVARPGWLDRVVTHLPGWFSESALGRALRGGSVRWNPTQFRVTSAVARSSDRRVSFLKPASTNTDTARVANGLTHVWRNGTALEFRPVSALMARWDLTSLRDLRRYADSAASPAPVGEVAALERSRLLGMDIGLERERVLQSAFTFAPAVAAWLRPHVELGTSYTMTRDPNTRTLLRENDSTGAFRLPRRLTSSQTFTAGATLDLAGIVRRPATDSGVVTRLARAVQPAEITFNRSLLSAVDGTAVDAPLSYQLALGGIGSFRSVGGKPATSAGLTTQVAITNTVLLPFGWSVANRVQRVNTRTWTRRLTNQQALVDGAQLTFPDVSLRWSYNPPVLRSVITSVGTQLRVSRTRQAMVTPPDFTAAEPVSDSTITTTYPMSGSITWAFGGLSTSGGHTVSKRHDAHPGSATDGTTRESTIDIAKPFQLPASWGAKSDLRTSVGVQTSQTQSFVYARGAAVAGARRSRLTDNGRTAVNLKGDTDLSETATFSLVASRVVTFDRNYNRRLTDTIFSAILHLQFFSGQLR